jgi:hypothetical protein
MESQKMHGDKMEIRKKYKVASFFAWSMLGVLALYILVVEFVRIQHNPFRGFSPGLMGDEKSLYYGLAIIMLLAVGSLKNSLLKKLPQEDTRALVNKLFLSTVITFSLCELPAILGLAVYLLEGLYKEFYILVGYSAFVMAAHFPRYTQWEGFLENQTGSPSA